MFRQKITSFSLVFALAGLTALAGCNGQQRQVRSDQMRTTQVRDTQTRDSQMRSNQNRSASTTMADRTPATRSEDRAVSAPAAPRGSWPTRRGDSSKAWTSMAYPTGKASTSAVGIEKGMPREVRLNQPFEYDLVVTNLTDTELSNVVLTDTVENNMRITGSSPQGRSGTGGANTWALGSLGPRESKVVRVQAAATAEGTAGSCASVSYASSLCSTVPVTSPKLRLTKTGPSEVTKCDAITYNFEVTNTGSGTIDNVRINDQLPAGLVSASGGRTITFDAGSLRAGQSKPFTAKVMAERTGRFENRASATGGGGITAESGAVATVVRQPVLTISKDCPTKQFVGRPLNYTITVTNTGDGIARKTVIEDQIPSGTTFVSASDGGSHTGGRVVWNLGALQPRATKTVTMRLSPTNSGTFRNTATARATCANPVSDTCQTEVTGIPAILLEVVDVDDPIQVGDNDTYVITVTNQGSAPGTNITIVCTLESNQQFVSASGATRGTGRGNMVTFAPLPSLAAKAKATFRVVVKCVKAGDTRFTVKMTSDQLTRSVDETEATNIYE